MIIRVLAHNPLFSSAYRLITSHCYFNESKETGFTYGMQVMVEILQPRNSQSLSSSLFLCLVRETGNEVGKDLDIRHFEVELGGAGEISGRLGRDGCQVHCGTAFGEQICLHVENGSPKTVPQCTISTGSPAQPQNAELQRWKIIESRY